MRPSRIILVTEDLTEEQIAALVHLFQREQVNWWHWSTPLWLFIDPGGRHPGWWRDGVMNAIAAFAATPNIMVFEMDLSVPGNWGGYLSPRAYKWLKQFWKPQSPVLPFLPAPTELPPPGPL